MNTLYRLLVAQDWSISTWAVLILLAEALALLTLPSVLLQRRGQPLSALSWFLAMVALPFLGVLAWWGIGRSHLERKRRRKRSAHGTIREGFRAMRPTDGDAGADGGRWGPALPDADGVFPPVRGNRVEVLTEGRAAFEALEALVLGAERHLHLLFYAWEPDATGRRFRDLLARRASEGVKVRVLLDALGSSASAGSFMAPLRRAGARVAVFSPTRFLRRSLSINFRNHRKVAVADGCLAYTGGFNIGDDYAVRWRDAGLLLRGPAVAYLQEVFADDWYYATSENLADPRYVEGARPCPEAGGTGRTYPDVCCALVAGGPDLRSNPTQDAFFLTITGARERLWITTPYLIPTAPIQAALRAAVQRGVDVRLLVPRRSDQRLTAMAGRSYYPVLLASGIRIFEYLPEMVHSKVWVVDREGAVVGSANLDTRSFRLNFEACCFLGSSEVNAHLAGVFLGHLAESEEMDEKKLALRGSAVELAEALMNLLSPLL